MSSISIQKTSIVNLDTDAIVNAANEGLWAGGGVGDELLATIDLISMTLGGMKED